MLTATRLDVFHLCSATFSATPWQLVSAVYRDFTAQFTSRSAKGGEKSLGAVLIWLPGGKHKAVFGVHKT